MKKLELHILFLGIPSRGHTFPTLKFIKALIQEGCKVTYFNTNAFKDDIEACGALFVDYNSHALSNISIPITSMEPHEVTIELQKIFFKSTLEIIPTLDFFQKQNRYDAVIYDQMALWGQLFADKYKLLSFCSNTMFLFNRNDIIKQIPKFLDSLDREYHMKLGELSSVFPELGSYSDVLDIQTAAKANYIVTYYPESLYTTPAGFNKDKIIYLGNRFNSQYFPSLGNLTEKSNIYISFGTVFNEKPDLFKLFIEVFGKTKHKVTISTGLNESAYNTMNKFNKYNNIKIYEFVDQLQILNKSCLFITHAGFNGICESLYFAVPMLMIPHVPEQYFNAKKIQDLHVGSLLREEDISFDSLIRALNNAETNWQFSKAVLLKIREYFLKSDDNIMAAKKITSLCNKNQE